MTDREFVDRVKAVLRNNLRIAVQRDYRLGTDAEPVVRVSLLFCDTGEVFAEEAVPLSSLYVHPEDR